MKCEKCGYKNTSGSRFCSQCGIKLDISDTPTEFIRSAIKNIDKGVSFFGRYEVIEEIGKGGMGAVYRVFDRTANETVALKIIIPEFATDKIAIERFNQELKIARKISHRNVCRMFDIGEEKGVYYITMEYIAGDDLRSLLKRIGQINIKKTIDISKQICAGLAEAHAVGVVHRDLKPQNIMIDRDGVVKIMDFGIARSISQKGVTTTGIPLGTPDYMSPEQTEGVNVDQRSDIYSFGIVLFELLTGQLPFEGNTPFAVAFKHKIETPPNPKNINIHIPEKLEDLVLKCLEKEKESRYQTINEVLADLNKIGQSLLFAGEKINHPTNEVPKGNKFKIGLRIGAIVVIIGASVLGIRQILDKTNSSEIAEPELTSDEIISDKDSVPDTMVSENIHQNNSEFQSNKEAMHQITTVREKNIDIPDRQQNTNGGGVTDRQHILETKISNMLKAYEMNQYSNCMEICGEILQINPGNEQASKYMLLAEEKMEQAEIEIFLNNYIDSFSKIPVEFFKYYSTPEVYNEIKPDIEAMTSIYEKFRPSISGLQISTITTNTVEIVFSQNIIGVRKGTSVEKDIFSGTMKWELTKQGKERKITRLDFIP